MRDHHTPITLDAAKDKYPGLTSLQRFLQYDGHGQLVEVKAACGRTDLFWYRGEEVVYITSIRP